MEKALNKNKQISFKNILVKVYPYFILLLLSILIMVPFMCKKGLNGHDIYYHLNSINSLSKAYDQGCFLSRIYEIISLDYGYGTGLFYSMIPSGMAVLLMKWFNMSGFAAICFEITLVLFIAGIITYLFLNRVFKDKKAAIILSCLYIFFPYVFVNIYTRFAFSEILIIPIIPIIMWSIYELVHKQNYTLFVPLFIVGFSLSIMIHLSLTFYFFLFALIYLAINYKKVLNKKSIIFVLLSSVCVLLISASFYLPMFVNYGEITLNNMAGTGKSLYLTTVAVGSLYLYLPAILIFGTYIIYLIIFIKKRKTVSENEKKSFIFNSIFIFICSPLCFLWLIAGFAPFNMIQFVWRLYLLGALLCTFMLKFIYDNIKEKLKDSFKLFYTFGCIVMVLAILSVNLLNAFIYAPDVDKNFDKDINMLLSISGAGMSDYMPKGATNDSVEQRLNEKYILKKSENLEASSFANYQSLKQFQFTAENTKDSFVTIKIPESVCEGLVIYQIKYIYPYETKPLELSFEEINSENYLKIELEDCEQFSKIILDYANCEKLNELLKQSPEEFLILDGDKNAKFTNFEKKNAHTYSVEISVDSKTIIELPTLYYKGYKITYKTEDSEALLTGTHGENGFIEIEVEKSGKLFVEFEAKYVTASNIISVIGVAVSVVFCILTVIIIKRERKNI